MKNLGFGMMRLPVISGETDFDYPQLEQMVDEFMAQGYTYFDTSFVYHEGKSEEAVRKALVERHPRESYTVATKFPTFNMVPEDQVDAVFESQLVNLGVDYIDLMLLHQPFNDYYGAYRALEDMYEEGMLKAIGVSNFYPDRLVDLAPFTKIPPMVNQIETHVLN